ncbi:hypothetical protein SEA_SATIS_324 [Streptomyces phage Satis]|nr:hypothetical protein SEA_SATIS_324 [Streptomyces phage Satis]QBZ72210.1 hypothetical protein SEA_KRADAL_324 [Streptomyces phage Kradal]QPL14632.1 hypothetical protein SEA_EHYELIMAYOE_327 [Streptomyces phage EhyElimayoE]
MTVWTYTRPAKDDGTPERVEALITEGGEGSMILPRRDLHGGTHMGDRLSAHADIAARVVGCPVVLAGIRPAGPGYNFWGFPSGEEERNV